MRNKNCREPDQLQVLHLHPCLWTVLGELPTIQDFYTPQLHITSVLQICLLVLSNSFPAKYQEHYTEGSSDPCPSGLHIPSIIKYQAKCSHIFSTLYGSISDIKMVLPSGLYGKMSGFPLLLLCQNQKYGKFLEYDITIFI